MKTRSLTVLWLVVFLAQSGGATRALHMAVAHSHGTDSRDARTGFHADGDSHASGHDPAHCAVCQALASAKPLSSVHPAVVIRLEPLWVTPIPCEPVAPAVTPPHRIAPRAPPAV